MKKITLLLTSLLLLTACTRTEGAFDQFAQCLTDKGVKMYGSNTCPHCNEQKKSFKGSFDLITYVECNQNPTACQEAAIDAYPTWEIDGKRTEGRKSLSELSELTGCALNATDTSQQGE